MKEVVCPECGGSDVSHYTDAYVQRNPIVKEDGSLELLDVDTLEYEKFFQCSDCGHRPSAEALIACAMESGANKRTSSFTAAHGFRVTSPHS
jgi:transcription elongation factor Elf1